jgi:hypothetical protein
MPKNDGLEFTEIPDWFSPFVDRRVGRLIVALPRLNWDLRALLRSVYLQGFHDAADGYERAKDEAPPAAVEEGTAS